MKLKMLCRDLDMAESCYRRILAVDPLHVQGKHNLCVVWVEKGLLATAETCLMVGKPGTDNEILSQKLLSKTFIFFSFDRRHQQYKCAH